MDLKIVAWALLPLLLLPHVTAVRADIRSVRYGTSLLQSRKSDPGNRSQGRLLHQGMKITSSASGSCKNVIWEDRVTIAARHDEDVSWMAVSMTPYLPYLVYSISGDGEATHRTASNTGREAQAYVQFIVDYYDCLPQYMAFIHAHRSSPHSPDMLNDLKRLQWQNIPGFMSLSRPVRNSTFYFKNPNINKPEEGDTSELAHWSQFAYEQNINIKAHWEELFYQDLGQIPDILNSPNCGQFAATRDRIQAHSKAFWQKQLDWMRSTSMDGFWAGLIYEHVWSYVLGAGWNYTHPPECSVLSCDGGQSIQTGGQSVSEDSGMTEDNSLAVRDVTNARGVRSIDMGEAKGISDPLETSLHNGDNKSLQKHNKQASQNAGANDSDRTRGIAISLQLREPSRAKLSSNPVQ